MSVTGLHHFNIRGNPADIERVRRFYIDVLGLQEGWRAPSQSSGYWLYAGADPVLHLLLLPQARESAPLPADAPGFDHVALRCEDLDAILQRLGERGIEYRLTKVPVTGHLQAFLRDPMGNGLELNQAP